MAFTEGFYILHNHQVRNQRGVQSPNQAEQDDDNDGDEDSGFGIFNQFTLRGPQRIDKGNEVWLVLDLRGHPKANCSVKVMNGEMQITLEEKASGGHSFWHQTMEIPVPPDVDPSTLQIKRNKEDFTIIFKKIPGGAKPPIDDDDEDEKPDATI
jgi:hypothetical protein